jgi:hypothetical protein
MNIYERPENEALRNTNEGGQLRILRITDSTVWAQDVDDYGHINLIHINTLYAGNHKNMNRFYELLGHQVRIGYGVCNKSSHIYKRWLKYLADDTVENPVTCLQDYASALIRGEIPL